MSVKREVRQIAGEVAVVIEVNGSISRRRRPTITCHCRAPFLSHVADRTKKQRALATAVRRDGLTRD